MPPGRAIAAGPEVSTPPSDDQPDQLEPFQLRIHSALSRPRMKTRMSPIPCAATAGSSSTTSARAGAAPSAARQHASVTSTLRRVLIAFARLAPGPQMPEILAREPRDEARVVVQVASPQPARLLGEAERPLEAEA